MNINGFNSPFTNWENSSPGFESFSMEMEPDELTPEKTSMSMDCVMHWSTILTSPNPLNYINFLHSSSSAKVCRFLITLLNRSHLVPSLRLKEALQPLKGQHLRDLITLLYHVIEFGHIPLIEALIAGLSQQQLSLSFGIAGLILDEINHRERWKVIAALDRGLAHNPNNTGNTFSQMIQYKMSDPLFSVHQCFRVLNSDHHIFLADKFLQELDDLDITPKVTAQMFALIFGDSFIENTKLEGGKFSVTIEFLIDYLTAKKKNGDLLCPVVLPRNVIPLLQMLKEFNHKINDIERDEYSKEKSNSDEERTIVEKEGVKDVAREIIKRFKNTGEILVPGGWTDASGGHAMLYHVGKNPENGTYFFNIYNTGDGIEYHDRLAKFSNKVLPVFSLEEIHPELVETTTFWTELIGFQYYRAKKYDLPEYSAKDIYAYIHVTLGGQKRNLSDFSIANFVKAQEAGTCTWKVLMAFLAINMKRQDFNLLKFHLKLTILGLIYQKIDKILESGNRSSRILIKCLLTDGIRKHAKTLIRDNNLTIPFDPWFLTIDLIQRIKDKLETCSTINDRIPLSTGLFHNLPTKFDTSIQDVDIKKLENRYFALTIKGEELRNKIKSICGSSFEMVINGAEYIYLKSSEEWDDASSPNDWQDYFHGLTKSLPYVFKHRCYEKWLCVEKNNQHLLILDKQKQRIYFLSWDKKQVTVRDLTNRWTLCATPDVPDNHVMYPIWALESKHFITLWQDDHGHLIAIDLPRYHLTFTLVDQQKTSAPQQFMCKQFPGYYWDLNEGSPFEHIDYAIVLKNKNNIQKVLLPIGGNYTHNDPDFSYSPVPKFNMDLKIEANQLLAIYTKKITSSDENSMNRALGFESNRANLINLVHHLLLSKNYGEAIYYLKKWDVNLPLSNLEAGFLSNLFFVAQKYNQNPRHHAVMAHALWILIESTSKSSHRLDWDNCNYLDLYNKYIIAYRLLDQPYKLTRNQEIVIANKLFRTRNAKWYKSTIEKHVRRIFQRQIRWEKATPQIQLSGQPFNPTFPAFSGGKRPRESLTMERPSKYRRVEKLNKAGRRKIFPLLISHALR